MKDSNQNLKDLQKKIDEIKKKSSDLRFHRDTDNIDFGDDRRESWKLEMILLVILVVVLL